MLIVDILAAAAEATPQNKFGFWEAMEAGGTVAWTTVIHSGHHVVRIVLHPVHQVVRAGEGDEAGQAHDPLWKAASLREGAAKLEKNSAWRQLVDDGLHAEQEAKKLVDETERHDWLHASLARSEASINAKLASGLPFLASTGATAPFIGLFGTVVGIYRALISIGLAGSASIDKVAGPVGEALIMTALGLLVAVPAVLAYNYLQSRNKVLAEMLTGFSAAVLANIASNGQVKPQSNAPAAAPAKPAAAPAKA
jgi:biopolymer transport protein ExbB